MLLITVFNDVAVISSMSAKWIDSLDLSNKFVSKMTEVGFDPEKMRGRTMQVPRTVGNVGRKSRIHYRTQEMGSTGSYLVKYWPAKKRCCRRGVRKTIVVARANYLNQCALELLDRTARARQVKKRFLSLNQMS